MAAAIAQTAFLNEKGFLLIVFLLKPVPKDPINNKLPLVQAVVWRRAGVQAIIWTIDGLAY